MNWYLNCLSKYAVFSGRARRTEFWMFCLFNSIISLAISFVCGFFIAVTEIAAFSVLSSLYTLFVLVPGIAVTIRRLHDTGRSGAWYFISFLPIVGGIVLLVFLCEDGTPNNNQYGPDPKGRGGFKFYNNTGNGRNGGNASGGDDYILN